MALTPGALRALKLLTEGDDLDIICEGIYCYIGLTRIAWRTVNQLIWATAVSVAGWSNRDSGPRYYIINATGRAILRRPELADEVTLAILGRKPFSINEQDKIVPLGRPKCASNAGRKTKGSRSTPRRTNSRTKKSSRGLVSVKAGR